MVIVNKSQVSLSGNKLIAEASTIGLAPGEWPDFISVVDDGGKGFLFQRDARPFSGGEDEIGGFNYHARGSNVELVVFND